MFENLTNKLEGILNKLKKAPSLNETQVETGLKEIREALLAADVSLPVVKKFIEEIKDTYNLKNSQICISGFSQGCMMSLNIGLTSEESFNCVVGFSGKIISKDDISLRLKSKPKIMLIHGNLDEVVSPNYLLDAKDFLIRNKLNIQTLMIENCGHHIPIEASSAALNFIKKNLKT